MALMNAMCDMCQFVVVVPVPDESSATLAEYFMQHVLMKFGLCYLVVLDDGSPFKGAFIAMCNSLNLNHDVLAKRNHKGLTVEHFHRFLNKSVTIAAEDRGTNDTFVPAGIAAGYAWNSSPIDGTDILRSIPAIGRELHFPLDINLSALPKLVHNSGQSALDYLKLTDSSRHFSSSILKILIEDRRTAHAERINNNRNIIVLEPGDIVMARTAIQSNKQKGKVAKLCYAVRGPYQIIRTTGRGSYFVHKLHKPDSPELKFMAYDSYPLPPSLKPCEPVDTTDTRYLNQSHTPITNPLKKALNIELYNEKWFDNPLKTSVPPFLYKHRTLAVSPISVSPFPSIEELHHDTNTCPPLPLVESVDDTLSSPPSPLTLHTSLAQTGCLFFIQYLPDDTIKPRWFLVQVNHIETKILKMDPSKTGDYHVTFLSRHPDDNHLCDDAARWWPEWHEYSMNDENIPVYGSRMLFKPNRKPDLKKYMLWSDSVHLNDSSCFIHGPFNFDSRSDVVSAKQFVALCHWEYLLTSCITLGIVPPTISTLTATKPRKRRKIK